MKRSYQFLFISSILLLGLVENTEARTKPKWELGIGLISLQTSHYTGSNYYYRYNVPYPYIIYRFDDLELSRDSRLYLLDTDYFQIDIAAAGSLPVFSKKENAREPSDADDPNAIIVDTTNYARRGMPDIPIRGSLGLRARLYLTDHFVLEAPYYWGRKLESGFGDAGNTFAPTFWVEFFDRNSDHRLALMAQRYYGSEQYMDIYYEVDEKYALPDRPAYDAKEGLIGVFTGIVMTFQVTDRLKLYGGYYRNSMKESVVKDSPLVKSLSSSDYYFALSYSFFQSSKTVTLP